MNRTSLVYLFQFNKEQIEEYVQKREKWANKSPELAEIRIASRD